MQSRLPKVLHHCMGKPLVSHVIELALSFGCSPVVVVVDPKGERVKEVLRTRFPKVPLVFAVQKMPLGTADATRAGLCAIPDFVGETLVLYGDVPLLAKKTLSKMARAYQHCSLALLTANVENPHGYGRIVRNGKWVQSIVEHADCTPQQRQISEVNAGVYLCNHALLRKAVARVGRKNAQQEAYLTDVVGMAAKEKGALAVQPEDAREIRGVNTRAELAEAEAIARKRIILKHQLQGVTIRDPEHTLIEADAKLGTDVEIGSGVQLLGSVRIASLVRIEGPTVVKDSVIEQGSVLHGFCHVEGTKIGQGAVVGPFARLRPGTILEAESKVGNFVETKKTKLGKKAKANHLTYLGDAEIGEASNIGAGTITCNYDGGPVKHQTKLGKRVFIGSNTTLVAPVRVGEGAYVGAGSTINQDIPKDTLAIGRARQVNKAGYAKRVRQRIDRRKP